MITIMAITNTDYKVIPHVLENKYKTYLIPNLKKYSLFCALKNNMCSRNH